MRIPVQKNTPSKDPHPKLWPDRSRSEKKAYWLRADAQIARRVRLARLLSGLDTATAARTLALSADNLRQIERGKLRLSADTLFGMCALYRQTAEDIIGPVSLPPQPARPTTEELGRAESRLLLGAFGRIKKGTVRRELADLAVQIAAVHQRRLLQAGLAST
jgi:transcriptional regulator with XRE-family HTH domain